MIAQTLPLNNIIPGEATAASVAAEPMTGSPESVGRVGDSGSEACRAADFDVVAHVADALTVPSAQESGPELLLLSKSKLPEKRIRKQRKGKDPEVVEGDDLVNTPKMVALVWSSLALNLAYLLQVNARLRVPFMEWAIPNEPPRFVCSVYRQI